MWSVNSGRRPAAKDFGGAITLEGRNPKLGRRYEYNGDAILALNELQQRMKSQIDEKVRMGKYDFEKVPCAVCNQTAFETLSRTDRYGLLMPVVICETCGLIQTNPRMTQAA